MKKFLVMAAFAGLLVSCSDSSTSPGCPEYVDVTLRDIDVYGSGQYVQYRSEFERQTGCISSLNCNLTATVKMPLDDYQGVKWCMYW